MGTAGAVVSVQHVDSKGIDKWSGRFTEHGVHRLEPTVEFGSRSGNGKTGALTPHAIISLIPVLKSTLLQGVGIIDLSSMGDTELCQVQKQLLRACVGFDLICGSVLVRDTSYVDQPVRWGAIRHVDLSVPTKEFRRRLMTSAQPRLRRVYDFISTELDAQMRAGWRLHDVLAHPKVLISLCDEWQGTDMYTTFLAHRFCGIESLFERFFLAEMPLAPNPHLNEDQVKVILRKEQNMPGGGKPETRREFYVTPDERYEVQMWHNLRAEGNDMAIVAQILEMP